MSRLRGWIQRVAGLLPSARRDREVADEIESHLAMHIDDNLRAGMKPAQARREAVMRLGGVESTKQAYRESRTVPIVRISCRIFDSHSGSCGRTQDSRRPRSSYWVWAFARA